MKTGCVYRGQTKQGFGSNAYQNALFLAFQNGEAKRVSKTPLCLSRATNFLNSVSKRCLEDLNVEINTPNEDET